MSCFWGACCAVFLLGYPTESQGIFSSLGALVAHSPSRTGKKHSAVNDEWVRSKKAVEKVGAARLRICTCAAVILRS